MTTDLTSNGRMPNELDQRITVNVIYDNVAPLDNDSNYQRVIPDTHFHWFYDRINYVNTSESRFYIDNFESITHLEKEFLIFENSREHYSTDKVNDVTGVDFTTTHDYRMADRAPNLHPVLDDIAVLGVLRNNITFEITEHFVYDDSVNSTFSQSFNFNDVNLANGVKLAPLTRGLDVFELVASDGTVLGTSSLRFLRHGEIIEPDIFQDHNFSPLSTYNSSSNSNLEIRKIRKSDRNFKN